MKEKKSVLLIDTDSEAWRQIWWFSMKLHSVNGMVQIHNFGERCGITVDFCKMPLACIVPIIIPVSSTLSQSYLKNVCVCACPRSFIVIGSATRMWSFLVSLSTMIEFPSNLCNLIMWILRNDPWCFDLVVVIFMNEWLNSMQLPAIPIKSSPHFPLM